LLQARTDGDETMPREVVAEIVQEFRLVDLDSQRARTVPAGAVFIPSGRLCRLGSVPHLPPPVGGGLRGEAGNVGDSAIMCAVTGSADHARDTDDGRPSTKPDSTNAQWSQSLGGHKLFKRNLARLLVAGLSLRKCCHYL
jgi:hypothetical protein